MTELAEAGREFWRDVLLSGEPTQVPRWTLQPVTGVAEHEAAVPDGLVAGLRRLADELEVSLGSVLLAAHAKVLAALTGEAEVTTGYVAPGDSTPLPCRLTTGSDSWRSLLLDVHRVESELLAHRDLPVDELRRELGVPGPSFETVLDPTGEAGPPAEATVLQVGLTLRDGSVVVRLRYRTDALDADCATRIAGYHLTALTLMAADADAEHGRQSLLSPEELDLQLVRQPSQPGDQVVGDRRLVLGHARDRLEGPPRDLRGLTREQHVAPELPAGLHQLRHHAFPPLTVATPSRAAAPFVVSAQDGGATAAASRSG